MSTHYTVLQVSPDASTEVIKAAYRALQRSHHPDLGGDAAVVGAINHAWEVLGDPESRRRYDAELAAHGTPSTPASSSGTGWGGDAQWSDESAESDWGAESDWADAPRQPQGSATPGVADGWRAGDSLPQTSGNYFVPQPGPGPMPAYVPGGLVPARVKPPLWPTVWGRSLAARIAGGIWLAVSLAPLVAAVATVNATQLSALLMNSGLLLALGFLSLVIGIGRARRGRITVPYVLWIILTLALTAYVVFVPPPTSTDVITASYFAAWLAAFMVMTELRARDARRWEGR